MSLPGEAVRFGENGGHALEAFVAKLGDVATHGAQQMFVMWHIARGFVPLETFAEIALDY